MGHCAERGPFGGHLNASILSIVCIHKRFVQEVWLFVFHRNRAAVWLLKLLVTEEEAIRELFPGWVAD